MSLISYRPHSLDGNSEDLHFVTLDLPNSKFKLHRTHKSWDTYKLQYRHCFFGAKTGLDDSFNHGISIAKHRHAQ